MAPALSILLLLAPADVGAQVLRLAELDTERIRALDRERTVVIMPGGILEQHGPYLPSYADGYRNEFVAGALADSIAGRPGWTAVLFPPLPLGYGGANEIGGRFAFPGTYAVRPTTLRAAYMDLADELGAQGFRWIFVLNGHGNPVHNRVIDEAGDYFGDTYGGVMVHLFGYVHEPSLHEEAFRAVVSERARAENGFTLHAGLGEHAWVRYLRPDLVPESVEEARSVTGRDPEDLMRIGARSDWPGYFGAPRYATAEMGKALLGAQLRQIIDFAFALLDGADPSGWPRYADRMLAIPAVRTIVERSARRDSAIARRQWEWLEGRGSQAASPAGRP